MAGSLVAESSVTISAGSGKVWKAITTPSVIKQYLFGTTVESTWKEGEPISYKGEYNGKAYEDKGTILKMVPGKLFESTYWSSMGGKEDKPENYNKVAYQLDEKDGQTTVTITQDNIGSEDEKKHMVSNWDGVLVKLKEVIESAAGDF